MTEEQPLGGGAAFWAARGVRIEPEPPDEEPGAEPGPEAAAGPGGAATAQVPGPGSGPEPEAGFAVPAPEDEPGPGGRSALGFPQQRATGAGPATAPVPVPAQAAAGSAAAGHAAPFSGTAPEASWQLTGGELANPLPPLKTCLEAILMVVDEPIAVVTLAQVLEHPRC